MSGRCGLLGSGGGEGWERAFALCVEGGLSYPNQHKRIEEEVSHLKKERRDDERTQLV